MRGDPLGGIFDLLRPVDAGIGGLEAGDHVGLHVPLAGRGGELHQDRLHALDDDAARQLGGRGAADLGRHRRQVHAQRIEKLRRRLAPPARRPECSP